MVAIKEEAVFRCLHSTAPVIAWKVNGSVVSQRDPPPDITPGRTLSGSGNVVDYTLTIVAHSNYNETEVVCVAIFIGSSMLDEETTPVRLLIQGEIVIIIFMVGLCVPIA